MSSLEIVLKSHPSAITPKEFDINLPSRFSFESSNNLSQSPAFHSFLNSFVFFYAITFDSSSGDTAVSKSCISSFRLKTSASSSHVLSSKQKMDRILRLNPGFNLRKSSISAG